MIFIIIVIVKILWTFVSSPNGDIVSVRNNQHRFSQLPFSFSIVCRIIFFVEIGDFNQLLN